MHDPLHKPILCGALLGAFAGTVLWLLVFNGRALAMTSNTPLPAAHQQNPPTEVEGF